MLEWAKAVVVIQFLFDFVFFIKLARFTSFLVKRFAFHFASSLDLGHPPLLNQSSLCSFPLISFRSYGKFQKK